MPKLKPETVRGRYAQAKVAVEAAEAALSEVVAEGARLDGIYLCASHPTGTSYGGKKEKQLQHVRWQLTRKDGSSYPKGTLGYEEALEQCERGKRYATACKQLNKAQITLARWKEKLAALDSTSTPPPDSEKRQEERKESTHRAA